MGPINCAPNPFNVCSGARVVNAGLSFRSHTYFLLAISELSSEFALVRMLL